MKGTVRGLARGNDGSTAPRAEIPAEHIDDLAAWGIRAFTTLRRAGTFGTSGVEPVGEVMSRWHALLDALASQGPRFATAGQVHGDRVVVHNGDWEGWLRVPAADGHVAPARGTGMAVTVADCVPVFIAHPSGAAALLHSGWRGTAARIVERAIAALTALDLAPGDLRIHLGPAICGDCYEVSPDVHGRLTGHSVSGPTRVDLRMLIADHARAAGVRRIDISNCCTLCDNERFFSHRAGDTGRQLGVLMATQ
ncbi:MAG: polyphenol oxidase family protein [Gemmatimonadaceae bacterium]